MILKWCLGRESNPHALTDTGFSYQLRLSPPAKMQFVVWTLSLPFTINSSQAEAVKSLHFSKNQMSFSDLARYCHFKGFTEFDFIHTEDFASDAQII